MYRGEQLVGLFPVGFVECSFWSQTEREQSLGWGLKHACGTQVIRASDGPSVSNNNLSFPTGNNMQPVCLNWSVALWCLPVGPELHS